MIFAAGMSHFPFLYSGVPFCDSHLEHERQNLENTCTSNTFLCSLDIPVTTPFSELCPLMSYVTNHR